MGIKRNGNGSEREKPRPVRHIWAVNFNNSEEHFWGAVTTAKAFRNCGNWLSKWKTFSLFANLAKLAINKRRPGGRICLAIYGWKHKFVGTLGWNIFCLPVFRVDCQAAWLYFKFFPSTRRVDIAIDLYENGFKKLSYCRKWFLFSSCLRLINWRWPQPQAFLFSIHLNVARTKVLDIHSLPKQNRNTEKVLECVKRCVQVGAPHLVIYAMHSNAIFLGLRVCAICNMLGRSDWQQP